MQEEQSLKDRIVEKLTNTNGAELDVTCNLTNSKQIELFTEEIGFKELGSEYIIKRADMYKRLTCSFQGKARDDLKAIGMTPEFQPGRFSYEDS